MWSREGLAKPPWAVHSALLSLEGVAKPPGAVPSAISSLECVAKPPNQPARPAWAAPAQRAPVAAPAPPQPINTNPNTNTNNDTNNDNKNKVTGGRTPLPVPSHGTTGGEGGAADQGVVLGGGQGGKEEPGKPPRERSEVGGQVGSLSGAWGCFGGDSCRRKGFGGEALAKGNWEVWAEGTVG